MEKKATAGIRILKVEKNQKRWLKDILAVEEPLEIQLGFGPKDKRMQKSISITMRTPGQDEDLAIGFLFTEGIIRSVEQIGKVKIINSRIPDSQGNKILVDLAANVTFKLKNLERHFYTSSSCGVCGKSSIEAVYQSGAPNIPLQSMSIDSKIIHQLPGQIRDQQSIFENTGGLHAAALFDKNGQLVLLREDVGRHNAVDKLIGAAVQNKMNPLHQYLIMLSGRVSFELVQKSLMAGISIIVAVGAPSTLAIQLAEASNISVIGFVRNGRYNIYSGEQRIV